MEVKILLDSKEQYKIFEVSSTDDNDYVNIDIGIDGDSNKVTINIEELKLALRKITVK